LWRGLVEFFKLKSTETLEFEVRECEHIFALLVLGSLVGLPQPPVGITLRLAPLLMREVGVMWRRAGEMDDFFGEIAAILGAGG